MTWPFENLKPFGYNKLILDPCWSYLNWSAKGEAKNAVAHYKCMTLDELKALPVGHLAAPNTAMLMWCTWPMIESGFALMKHYGFTYKTGGSWGKLSSTGRKVAFGPGYILRSADEPWLIGTIGKPKVCSHSVRNLFTTDLDEQDERDATDLALRLSGE